MRRAKRGFGSVRIVLVGMIALGALSACGGSSSSGVASTGNPAVNSGAGSGAESGSVAVTPTPPADTGTAPPPAATPSSTAVSLSWAAPTENSDGTPLTDLKGYKIHYGTESQNYSGSISVENPTVTTFLVDTLPAGTYYFAVTAYNAAGAESSLSDEVQRSLN